MTPKDRPALAAQVGGNHYKHGIQPFQLSMANGHDACIHAIQKYLTRYLRIAPEKGYEALQKAHHICMIRVETMALYGVPHPPEIMLIGIGDYTRSNKLPSHVTNVVRMVEGWHSVIDIDHHSRAEAIREAIRAVAKHDFPSMFKEEDFLA